MSDQIKSVVSTDTGDFNSAPQQLAGRNTALKIFMCPSHPDGNRNQGGQNGYQPSSYNGNSGTDTWNDDACDTPTDSCTNRDGVFYMNSSVGIRDITDGTSNTLLVSEVRCQLASSPTVGGDRKYNFSDGADGPGGSGPPKDSSEYIVGTENDNPINDNDQEASGSYHPGGAQFLMGDGTVIFLSENINMTTYRSLSTRAKNEVVSIP